MADIYGPDPKWYYLGPASFGQGVAGAVGGFLDRFRQGQDDAWRRKERARLEAEAEAAKQLAAYIGTRIRPDLPPGILSRASPDTLMALDRWMREKEKADQEKADRERRLRQEDERKAAAAELFMAAFGGAVGGEQSPVSREQALQTAARRYAAAVGDPNAALQAQRELASYWFQTSLAKSMAEGGKLPEPITQALKSGVGVPADQLFGASANYLKALTDAKKHELFDRYGEDQIKAELWKADAQISYLEQQARALGAKLFFNPETEAFRFVQPGEEVGAPWTEWGAYAETEKTILGGLGRAGGAGRGSGSGSGGSTEDPYSLAWSWIDKLDKTYKFRKTLNEAWQRQAEGKGLGKKHLAALDRYRQLVQQATSVLGGVGGGVPMTALDFASPPEGASLDLDEEPAQGAAAAAPAPTADTGGFQPKRKNVVNVWGPKAYAAVQDAIKQGVAVPQDLRSAWPATEEEYQRIIRQLQSLGWSQFQANGGGRQFTALDFAPR